MSAALDDELEYFENNCRFAWIVFCEIGFFLVISNTIMCYVWMMSLLPLYGIISLLYNGEIPFLVCIFLIRCQKQEIRNESI